MPSRFDSPPDGMPKGAADIYCYLAGETIRTRAKWIYFRQLYMDSEHRVEKLRKAGNAFFAELQNILVNDLILSLARLNDAARNKHQENLTISLFVEKLTEAGCTELATSLSAMNKSVKASIASLRTRRDKQIAHYDTASILTPEICPLPELTLKDIREALEAIENLLGHAHTHFTKGTFMWEALRTEQDVESLMASLCKAEVYDEMVEKGLIDRKQWTAKWEARAP